MDLKNKTISSTLGNLLTINTVAGSPTEGVVQNGDGVDVKSINIGGDVQSTNVNATTINATTVDATTLNSNIEATNLNTTNIDGVNFGSTVINSNGSTLSNVRGERVVGERTSAGSVIGRFIKVEWNTNYFNLNNNFPNYIPWDTDINNDPNNTVFEFRIVGIYHKIQVKRSGWYLCLATIHLYDMYADMDLRASIQVDQFITSPTTELGIIDEKFVEGQEDRTMHAKRLIYVPENWYITYWVNPSANSPYPSNTNNCPTSLTVFQIAT
jgi:hypothetical protein